MLTRDNMSHVVRVPAKRPRIVDPTIYPVEEKVGEDILQRWIAELLRPLIERWFRERRIKALVGADQFIYYRPHSPIDRVSPDVYVLPGVRPDTHVPSWKTWEKGIVPSFALEIVSKDWEEDYAEAPARYDAARVPELVVFDPHPARHPDRVVWQVFRRVGDRPLTSIEVTQGDRIRSKALGCFLRVVGSNESQRVRLGTGPRGDELFPTGEEAERAAREVAVAAAEVDRVARDAALAERDAALNRIAELEAKLRARKSAKRR